MVRCNGSKKKAAEIVDGILNNDLVRECYQKAASDEVSNI